MSQVEGEETPPPPPSSPSPPPPPPPLTPEEDGCSPSCPPPMSLQMPPSHFSDPPAPQPSFTQHPSSYTMERSSVQPSSRPPLAAPRSLLPHPVQPHSTRQTTLPINGAPSTPSRSSPQEFQASNGALSTPSPVRSVVPNTSSNQLRISSGCLPPPLGPPRSPHSETAQLSTRSNEAPLPPRSLAAASRDDRTKPSQILLPCATNPSLNAHRHYLDDSSVAMTSGQRKLHRTSLPHEIGDNRSALHQSSSAVLPPPSLTRSQKSFSPQYSESSRADSRSASQESIELHPSPASDGISSPASQSEKKERKHLDAVALFDWNASGPRQISFIEGDELKIHRNVKKWWVATNTRTNEKGLIPSNYVTIKKRLKRVNKTKTLADIKRIQAAVQLENETSKRVVLSRKIADKLTVDPYPFDNLTGKANELLDSGGNLLAASLLKIISFITDEPREKYVNTFLLTYRFFADFESVSKILTIRYQDPNPATKMNVQLGVIEFFNEWITNHFDDFNFANNPDLCVKYINDFISIAHKAAADEMVVKKVEALEKTFIAKRKIENIFDKDCDYPESILPKNGKAPIKSPLDIDPLEFARQLALIEFRVYKSIAPWECYGNGWMSEESKERSPNISNFIANFNKISNLVTFFILGEPEAKKRKKLISYFMKVVDCSKEIGNYNAVMEILSSLGNSAISRLKKSWGEKAKQKFQEYNSLFDHNFKELREATEPSGKNVPTLPYLGIFLKDLTFIDEGNEDIVDNLINWNKMQMQAKTISKIREFQKIPFMFKDVFQIQTFLVGKNDVVQIGEKEAYEKSLALEPRE